VNERGDARVSVDWGVLQRLFFIGIASAFAVTLQLALDAPVGQFIFMTLCVIVLMVLAIVFRAERRLPLLCDPLVIVFAFMAQFFLIGAPALFLLNFFIFRPMAPERGVLILGLFSVFVAAFFVGYQLRLGQILADRLPDFERSRRRMPWIWVETAIVLAGVIGCLAFISTQGGVGRMLRTGYGRSDAKPIFQLAYHTLLAGTFLMAWRVGSREKASRASWAPLVALIFAEVVFFGVMSGARKWLFYLFFGLVSMRLLRQGSRTLPKFRVAVTLALLVVFFAVWGTIRSNPLTEIVSGQHDSRTATRDPFHMGYFKSVSEPFEIASLVVDIYPTQRPYEYGRTLLVTLLGFIPRSAWPDKPVGIGKTLTRYTDGRWFQQASGHSIAPTLVGDFYANLGVVGVVLGAIVFGIACRAAASYATTGMTGGVQLQAARVIIPSVFVAGLAEVRGDSATMLAFYVMVLVPVVIACATARLEARPGVG
jgi:oligosaccharide repeat unit polymerase